MTGLMKIAIVLVTSKLDFIYTFVIVKEVIDLNLVYCLTYFRIISRLKKSNTCKLYINKQQTVGVRALII